jgi:hypothetical protein
VPATRVRLSTRWIANYTHLCKREIGIPYINNSGKIGLTTICRWFAHPLQVIATISATVFQRLQQILIRRHGTRFAFAHKDVTIRTAICYSISRNDWIIDRFLGYYKRKANNGPYIALLSKFIAQFDDDKRFVYSQAWQQAYWLTSRSERPRDKSKLEYAPGFASLFKDKPECACARYDCPYGDLLVGDLRIDKFCRGGKVSPADSVKSWQ